MSAPRDDLPPADSEKRAELDDLLRFLDRIPFLGALKNDLRQLRRLLYDRRTPRLMAIGAEGSGRTSLANALLRAPAMPLGPSPLVPADGWIRIDASGRRLDWLEVASTPLDQGRCDALRRAFHESSPDVVLLVVRAEFAEEEGIRARETFEALATLLDESKVERPRTVGVVTQVDRIARPEATGDGGARFSNEDLAKIDAATQVLKNVLEAGVQERQRRPVPVLAGAAIGASAESASLRWNVEEVASAIHNELPDAAKVEGVRALAVPVDLQRALARTIVNQCATAAVTIGLMPIPFSDAFLLLPLQGVMVSAVAYLAGQPWDRRAALEWLGSVGVIGGAAMGLRWSAQQLVKLLPGAGALISGSVAGAGTMAIGRSAIAYFVDGPGRRDPQPNVPPEAGHCADTRVRGAG